MAHSIATMKYLLVIYCLILNFSEFEGAFSGIDGNCFDDEVAICKEVSRACQITYDASGSRDFECACQYPFLERNGDCIYDPESHHFKLKMELTNMYPLIDFNDVINYHRLKEDLKEWLKGMFPDATIHVTNIWKKRLSFTLLEEFSHIFKQTPKTKIYAEARLSQSGLSNHKIKQTLNIACSSVCKTEMFSLVSPAQNAEIESLDSTECSVCGPTHICNPRASTLCSCKDNSTDCLDMPIPLRFQTLEETDLGDEFSASNLFSGFGRSEELGRAIKGFPKTLPPCPRYHQKLCQLINGDCVPSLSKGLSCECMENYVMSKTGTCTPINEIEDDVYRALLLLRNDAPWSDDLADKTSYRYLRLKRNALRFLKVVFPDARTSVLGFAPSNRRQRDSTGSQVQMEIVLVSDTTEYDEETISIRLQAYQVDNEVTVPGIAFSVYTEVLSDPVEVESTSSTTSSTLTSTTLLSSTSTSTSSTTSSTLTSTTSASSTTSTTTTSPETPTSTSSTTPFTTTGTSSAPPSTSTLISTVTTSTSTPTTSPVTTTGPPTTSTHSSTSTSSSTSSTLTSTTPASSTTSTTTASPEPPTSTSSTTPSTTTATSSTTPSTSTITSTITPSTSSTLTSTTPASSTTSTTTASPEPPNSTSSTTPSTTTDTSSTTPTTSTITSTVTTSTSTPTASPITTTGPPTTSTQSSTSTSSSTSSTLTSTTPASSTTSTTTASPEPPTSTSSTTPSTTTGTSSTTPLTSTITSTITPSTSSTLTSTTPASSTTSTTTASPEPPTSTSSTAPSTTTGTSSTTPSTSTITSTITPSTSSTLTSTTPAPSTTSTTTASPEPPTSTSSTTPSTTTGTSSTTPSTSTITSTITPSTSSTLTSTTPALSTTSTTTASPEPPTSTSSTTTSTTTDTSSTTPTTSTITSTITTSTSTTFPITTTETTSTSSQSSTSTATTTVSTTTTSQPPEDPCLNNDCLSRNQKCVPLSASDYKCVCGFPAIEETEDSDVFCSIVPTYDPYGGRVVIQLNSERDLTSDFTTDYIALRSEIEGNFDNDLFAKISHVSYFGLLETVSDLTLTVVFYINVQTDGTNPADISGLLEDIESRLGQQLHSTSYTMDLSTLEITKSLITCSTLNICAAGLDKYALCSNNATTNITQCTCSKGFREQYSICQDDDDCKGNPCANYGDNDAVCNDFYGYFKCNCSTGFIYANDDGCVPDPTLKNPCSPDPCDSDKSKCVKALNEDGYECKCFFPFVRRPDGSCSKTKPGKDKVYNITIPLTSLTVWTDDLSDPNSLAFLKLKKDAEKFIKAIFKDAVGQIQGFSKRPAATGRFFPSIPPPYRQQKSQKTNAFVELSVFDDSDCTDCDDSHECISESSSKKCICKPGMEQVGVNGNIAICEDVNECKDRNPCASYGDFGSKCINHDGRFLKYLCDCSPGYKFGRGSCIDKEVLREEQI